MLILFFAVKFFFRDEIMKHGVCIRVLGDLTLLPKDLQAVIADAMYLSRNNTRYDKQMSFSELVATVTVTGFCPGLL